MKKIIFLGLLLIGGIPFLSMGVKYNFTHMPVADFEVNTLKVKNGVPYMKYSGKTSLIPREVDLSVIEEFVKYKGYFKFIGFSYYWKNIFNRLDDGYISLDHLDREILKYPAVGVYVGEHMYMFVHYKTIGGTAFKKIGDHYKSEFFDIQRDGEWFVVKFRVTSAFLKDSHYYWPYKYARYFVPMRNMIYKTPVTHFQVGQNPFDRYYIQGFGDDLIQVELVLRGKFKGLILSLKKLYSVKKISTTHDQDYNRDQIMMGNLGTIYDAVKDYYKNNKEIANDLSSLYPNYFTYQIFNPYNYQVKYEVVDTYCFKVGFLPKSIKFKQTYSNQGDEGYVFKNYCIR